MHISTQNTGSKWPLRTVPSCSGMFLVASIKGFFSGCCDEGKHINAQPSFTSWSRVQLSQDCIMWIMAHGHMYRSARRTLMCNVEPKPNTNTKHAYHTVQWESSSELPPCALTQDKNVGLRWQGAECTSLVPRLQIYTSTVPYLTSTLPTPLWEMKVGFRWACGMMYTCTTVVWRHCLLLWRPLARGGLYWAQHMRSWTLTDRGFVSRSSRQGRGKIADNLSTSSNMWHIAASVECLWYYTLLLQPISLVLTRRTCHDCRLLSSIATSLKTGAVVNRTQELSDSLLCVGSSSYSVLSKAARYMSAGGSGGGSLGGKSNAPDAVVVSQYV